MERNRIFKFIYFNLHYKTKATGMDADNTEYFWQSVQLLENLSIFKTT